MNDDAKVQAAINELSQINMMLTQRCITHAADVVMLRAEIESLKEAASKKEGD